MNQLRYVVASILITVLVVGLAAFWFRERPPLYEGKPLEAWLAACYPNVQSIPDSSKRAVRHFGTNALPYLIGEVGAVDSPLKVWVLKWSSKLKIPIKFTLASERHRVGLELLKALGRDAEKALPALEQFLMNGELESAYGAVQVLDAIGPKAFPVWMRTLSASNQLVRVRSATALSSLSFQPTNIPPLLACLNDPDPDMRQIAVQGLVRMRSQSSLILPALVHTLTIEHDDNVRAVAIFALGTVRNDALEAIPILASFLDEPGSLLWAPSVQALHKIAPAEARAIFAAKIPGLLNTITDSGKDWTLRREAATRLGQIDLDGRAAQSIPLLIYSLRLDDPQRKFLPVEDLYQTNAILPVRIPNLVKLLEYQDDFKIRQAAAEVLGQLGTEAADAVPALKNALQDESTPVRAASAEALRKIEGDSPQGDQSKAQR